MSQLAIAALAAGVVTSYAVSQGQNPLIALGITIFSAVRRGCHWPVDLTQAST